MLTGKAKELFESFIWKKYVELNIVYLVKFNEYPLEMQWGVYQDFADSLGYFIDLQPCPCHNPPLYSINIDDRKDFIHNGYEDLPINEARKKAIDKLNEIINEK